VNHWYSLSLTALMYVATATVQPAVAAEEPATMQTNIDDLKARLNLTPDQQAKIAPLAEERRAKLEGIRGKLSSASSRKEKREVLQEAKAIQDDFAGKVEPLLTPEQQAEWQKIREETRSKMIERWRSNR
jgi:hypothetical protein